MQSEETMSANQVISARFKLARFAMIRSLAAPHTFLMRFLLNRSLFSAAAMVLIWGGYAMCEDGGLVSSAPSWSIDLDTPSTVQRTQQYASIAEGLGKGIQSVVNSTILTKALANQLPSALAHAEQAINGTKSNGYLLGVNIYTSSEGAIHPTNNLVKYYGEGTGPQDAAFKSVTGLSSDKVWPIPPPKDLPLDEQQSYYVWVQKKDGKLIVVKIQYPFNKQLESQVAARVEAWRKEQQASHDRSVKAGTSPPRRMFPLDKPSGTGLGPSPFPLRNGVQDNLPNSRYATPTESPRPNMDVSPHPNSVPLRTEPNPPPFKPVPPGEGGAVLNPPR
jgi:hypothetical protein